MGQRGRHGGAGHLVARRKHCGGVDAEAAGNSRRWLVGTGSGYPGAVGRNCARGIESRSGEADFDCGNTREVESRERAGGYGERTGGASAETIGKNYTEGRPSAGTAFSGCIAHDARIATAGSCATP